MKAAEEECKRKILEPENLIGTVNRYGIKTTEFNLMFDV